MTESPLLTVCISTRNRADFLPETLQSILVQCGANVEVLVLDGASTDRTLQVLAEFQKQFACLSVIASTQNGGIDVDFDRCVAAAGGRYCWLFSDDDLLVPTAIQDVLEAVEDGPTVVIVDAAVHGPDLKRCYERQRLKFDGKRTYDGTQGADLFRDVGQHVSFIGGVVVLREFWLARNRERYFGSYFAHVGVLFQAPIPGLVHVLGKPLVIIRYGLASWTTKTFDIWMYKWPELVWSFEWIPERVRASVSPRAPWLLARRLLLSRAMGAYGFDEYERLVRPRANRKRELVVPFLTALVPGWLTYAAARAAIYIRDPNEMTHVVLDNSRFRWGPKW